MVNLGMNEYLSKDFIEKILDAHLEDSRGAEHYAYDIVKRELMAAPGTSIKHGKWVWKDFGDHNGFLTLCCSECLETCGARENANYCPNCGAYMRETYLVNLYE